MTAPAAAPLRHDDDLGDHTASTLADLWSQSDYCTEDEDDTDDDRTSRSGSSIPWAEETVEENRQLWLRIEEMLYGERPLPATGALRSELQQWQRHRPHLRCRGTAVSVSGFGGLQVMGGNGVTEQQRDEVLAIHPVPVEPIRLNTPASLLAGRSKRMVPRTAAETSAASREAAQMLEHCLRISSSAWSRRPITTHTAAARHPFHRRRAVDGGAVLAPIVCATARRPDETDRLHSVRSDIHQRQFDEDDDDDDDDEASLVNRLRPLKMPPVFRVRPFHSRLDARPPLQPAASIDERQRWCPAGSAIRRRTILPPIDVDRRPADLRPVVIVGSRRLHRDDERSMGDLFGRSVSAVYVPSLNI